MAYRQKADVTNLDMDVNSTASSETNNKFPIAMAYVPWQNWDKVYDPEAALKVGTIFPDLYKPYYGKRGACP